MKLGIIGLEQSGRATIFAALTGARGEGKFTSDAKIVTVTVHDERVDFLSEMYKPKKTTYAKTEYMLPPEIPGTSSAKSEGGPWNQVRTCDALLHVVRNFKIPGGPEPTPEKDFWQLEEEMVLSDLVVAEKRIERIELDLKRGKKEEEHELLLVQECRDLLEKGGALRSNSELASNPALRGFTFLSAKPTLIICNNDDEDEAIPQWDKKPEGMELITVRGRLECDIASMSPEEAEEFVEMYNIKESALDRIIGSSFRLLNRISFFTVGDDEVRAWPVNDGTPAVEAAGVIHTDIQKGFIRAEVLSYEDLRSHGTYNDAKKAGVVRLEGKEYKVRDGDIIHFRFNV